MTYVFQCDICKKQAPEIKHDSSLRLELDYHHQFTPSGLRQTIEVCDVCFPVLQRELNALNKRLGLKEEYGRN
jgi:hypothetical protein